MKTKISAIWKSFILVVVLVIIAGRPGAAKAAEVATITRIGNLKSISKLEVSGNVEVLISQDSSAELKIYDNYYSKNALVQWEDGILRVCSYEKEKLTVLVSVSDLQAISASGTASVRSVNRLSSIDLEIRLQDKATATLSAQALNISTRLADHSKLELSGRTENQMVNMTESSTLQADSLEAGNRTMLVSDSAVATIGNTVVRSTAVPRYAKGF